MKKTILLLIVTTFLLLNLIFISAEQQTLGVFKQGQTVTLKQTCADCSYVNITQVTYPNSSQAIGEVEMTNHNNGLFTYTFVPTDMGEYIVDTKGDPNGVGTIVSYNFIVKNYNTTFFLILICLASLFFIATFFVNEEFFVYISGVLFLLSGIYVMINGIDIVNDTFSRSIAFVTIGIGFLFTIGAYIYNTYYKYGDNEEEY